jgi:hypothetical protein
MDSFEPSRHVARWAALLAAAGFAGVLVFQIALVAGVPWGHASWGGTHAHLTPAQRSGSGVSVIIWTTAILIVLGRTGFWARGRFEAFFYRGTWALAALSLASALPNFVSRSQWETLLFGPLALLFAILCTIIARSPVGAAQASGRSPALAASPEVSRARSRPTTKSHTQ